MLNHLAVNLPICHRCEHSKGCNGACPCKADPKGRDISDLAAANVCPLGYFGASAITAESTPEHVIEVLSRATRPTLDEAWHIWPGSQDAYRQLAGEFLSLYRRSPIFHVFHNLAWGHIDSPRNARARSTWGDGATLLPFTALRTAEAIGDERALPYVNDLFDYACLHTPDDGIVVWSNLDVCLVPGAYDRIREALAWQDACYSRRKDVDDASTVPANMSDDYSGCDLFAFRPHWWRAVRAEMPQMFLAAESFDAILMRLARRDFPSAEITPRIIYHQRHGVSHWELHPTSPGQKHNNRAGAEFARKLGIGVTPREDGTFTVHWERDKEKWAHRPEIPACPGRLGEVRKLLRKFPDADDLLPPEQSAELKRLRWYDAPIVLFDRHYGDCLNLIPGMKWLSQQGYRVVYLTTMPYGELVQGLPFVRLEVYDGQYSYEAMEQYARTIGRVMPHKPKDKWAIASWNRTGLSDALWKILPLEIENRDRQAEAELITKHVKGGKPLVLVNCVGHTSPYAHGGKLLAHLWEKFGGCEVLDLAGVRGRRFQDLLGLLELAKVLVTVDTGTLHLGYATKTPTIALMPENNWQAAPSREHWKLHITHGLSATPEGLKAIEDAIAEILAGDYKPVSFAPMVKHGAVGIAKAVTGTGGASEELIAHRTAICTECPHAVKAAGLFKTCSICKCSTWAKVRNAAERCPAGKW